jgi:hypothetical protein
MFIPLLQNSYFEVQIEETIAIEEVNKKHKRLYMNQFHGSLAFH